MKNSLFNKTILAITSSAILFGGLIVAGTSYAETQKCGDYDICPTEVKNKHFSLEKLVRKEGQVGYDREVTVQPGGKIEFVIRASNVGEVKTNDMTIVDYLPVEFKVLSGQTKYEFDNFKVGSQEEIKLSVQVSNDFKRDICLVNTAELFYQDIKENSASATVCVVKATTPADDGKVLAATTELPKTAGAVAIMLVPAALLIIGSVLSKRAKIA